MLETVLRRHEIIEILIVPEPRRTVPALHDLLEIAERSARVLLDRLRVRPGRGERRTELYRLLHVWGEWPVVGVVGGGTVSELEDERDGDLVEALELGVGDARGADRSLGHN